MSVENMRQSILAMSGRLAEEEAELPGTDGPVKIIVREMTGREANVFETAARTNRPNLLGTLLCMVIRDPETKELVFNAADRAAVEELGMTSLKPIVEIATRQSGLSDKDVEKAKADLETTPASA